MLHRTQTRVFSNMKFYAVDKQSQYIDKVCKLAELKTLYFNYTLSLGYSCVSVCARACVGA